MGFWWDSTGLITVTTNLLQTKCFYLPKKEHSGYKMVISVYCHDNNLLVSASRMLSKMSQHSGSGPSNTLVLDPPTHWFWRSLQHTGSGPSNTLVLEDPPTHWFWRSVEGLWGLKPFRSSFKSGKTTTLRLICSIYQNYIPLKDPSGKWRCSATDTHMGALFVCCVNVLFLGVLRAFWYIFF